MKILNYQAHLEGTSSIVATFDVDDHEMKCLWRSVRLVKSKKGHQFVSLPSLWKDGKSSLYFEPYGFERNKYEQKIKSYLEAEIAVEDRTPTNPDEIPF